MTQTFIEPYHIQQSSFDVLDKGLKNDLHAMLLYWEQYEFSDIHLQTGREGHADIHGVKHNALNRPLMQQEMVDIINALYRRKSASSLIAQGTPVDNSYDYKPDRENRYRYRFNGSGELSVGGIDGIQITIRRLASVPPTAKQLGLRQSDIDDFMYDNGLVVISGQTGSGKTSTLAAVIRHTLESGCDKKIVTAEAPIEYVFDKVQCNNTMITPAEVGRHITSFSAALRSSLRRAPEIIMVGEMRDLETTDAALEAALTGHLVWSTNHANGAPATMQRLVMSYDYSVQAIKMFTFCSVMRMCISQTLVKGIDGKRIALWEKLPFIEPVRDRLTSCPPMEILNSSRSALIEHGRPMILSAQEEFERGSIDQKVVDHIAKIYGDKVKSQA